MTIPVARFSVVAGTVALLAGCAPRPQDVADGDDPIKALASSAPSTRYQGPYWVEQRRTKSDVWQQAVAYCTPERVREYPNCQPVAASAEAERSAQRADSALRSIGAGAAGTRPARKQEF